MLEIFDVLGVFRRPLSAESVMEAAIERTGLSDFGEVELKEPLSVLLPSLEKEADLRRFGRVAARWDTMRYLMNLLLLREQEKKNPAIAAEPITAPIFITGLPRSGTTFMQNLLRQDSANGVVRCLDTLYPCPTPAEAGERRRIKVDRQLATFARLAPEFRKLYPISAESPQECTEITGHVFRSLRFDTTHHVPSYRRWLEQAGHVEAYRFHLKFLKYLQFSLGQGPQRWVLKCPDHVFALTAIRQFYPDAKFVFMHRDPTEVLASVARLTEVLRRPFSRHIDRRQIGEQVSQSWAEGASILVAADEEARLAPDAVFHLNFRRFIADPKSAVAALYERFGLELTPQTTDEVGRFIAAHPNGGYGRNPGRLEDYGLDAETERRRHRDYISRFGL